MNASRTPSAAARTAGPLFTAFLLLLAALSPAVAAPQGGGAGQFLALTAALRAAHTRAAFAAAAPRDPDATGQQNAPSGRALLDRRLMHLNSVRKPRAGAASNVVPVAGAVQTFDVFNPPPAFRPLVGFAGVNGMGMPALTNSSTNPPVFIGALTATNLTPVWSVDQTFLVFSSNRTQMGGVNTDGAGGTSRFHLWVISVGGGEAFQLTTSTGLGGGGEFFPALSPNNNSDLAFVSDAQSPGVRNLYVLGGFNSGSYLSGASAPVNVSVGTGPNAITSVTMRGSDPASGNPLTGFTQVGRPTFAPGSNGLLAFSALSMTGTYQGHNHIYFLYTNTGGFDPQNISFPGKFTDGPAEDTDPAWSQDGQFIAFASTAAASSTAAAFTDQPNGSNSFGPGVPGNVQDPNQSQVLSSAADGQGRRSIFFINGGNGGVSGNGAGQGQLPVSLQSTGGRITAAGTDDFGPAWSNPTIRNQYTNPAPGFEYIAFARGTSPTTSHDIYYLQVLRDINAAGETGRSTEAGTTPEPAAAPIYQIDAGNVNGSTPPFGQDQFFAGGTAVAGDPTPNTTNDPGTPPGIYNTDRNGAAAFSYTFPNLTPNATYTVRLHFADPTPNAAVGSRVFFVSANGQHETQIDNTPGNATTPSGFDIALATGTAPGQVSGLVSANGTPLAGATVTITPSARGAAPVTTTTTAAATTNYTVTAPAGTATETVSATGFGTQTQTISVNSNGTTTANFNLAPNNATLTGTVNDTNGGTITGVPVTVTDPATNVVLATTTSGNGGTFTVAVPAGTYNVTAQPNATRAATQTQQNQTFTAGQTTTVNFNLASGNAIGILGGLIVNAAGTPLVGATVRIQGANYVAIVTTTAATTTPAGPTSNGSPQNFQVALPGTATPGLSYSVTPSFPGTNTVQGNTASVINGQFNPDATQTLTATNTTGGGGNAATVQTFTVTVPRQDIRDNNGNIVGPAGDILLNFVPIKGNAIVQGIEILANTTVSTTLPSQSSGFGGFSNTSDPAGPGVLAALAGNGQVTLTFQQPPNTQAEPPTSYNIYRSPGAPTAVNQPGGGVGGEGSVPYLSNVQPTDNGNGSLTFVDTNVTNGDEYFYQVTAILQQRITPEGAQPNRPNLPNNVAIKLNTDDNAGQTSTAGNLYDDVYPTWSPFLSVFSIAYQSGNFQGATVVGGRTVTYNNPTTSFPTETAVSVGAGGSVATGDANAPSYTVGAGYTGILESQVLNLDPPTLLRFSNGEIVHVQAAGPAGTDPVRGTPDKLAASGGQAVTFTVRLSDREAGIDNTGGPNGGPRVYIQIKDPDSKYQDSQALEHKVFSHDPQFIRQSNQATVGDINSNTADAALGLAFADFEHQNTPNFPFQRFTYPSYGKPATGSPDIARFVFPRGAHGGQWPFPNGNNPDDTYIFVGKDGGGVNPVAGFQGGDPALFIPTGPEYEAQVVNPQFAASGNQNAPQDTSQRDYVSPFWLAGVDDQRAFSGGVYPNGTDRPTANVAGTNGNTPAEWLQLQPVPAAQQDNRGGVLYTVTFTTPRSVSDFYLDVIAYDKAVFPNFPAGTSRSSGGRTNWRIYDNVGGFSTERTIGNADILFVSDYALGQKFAATTFAGQQANLNLVPKLFGTESYLTDVDVNILPDRVYAGIPNPTTSYNFVPVLTPFNYLNPFSTPIPTQNGLGVGSYSDSVINTGGPKDGRTFDISQQYSIWRILSRGPVPQSILSAYTPTKIPQPVINDPQNPNKNLQLVPAKTILSAPRCIVWLSPYTGDLLTDPGTLDDPGSFSVAGQPDRASTQSTLTNFVQAGGRLFITGQDVGSALTLNGTVNNMPSTNPAVSPNFLPDVLNAQLKTSGGGSTVLSATPNRITGDPLYDGTTNDGHVGISYLTATGTFGNNIGSVGFQYPYQDHLELSDVDRNDAAFSQVPSIQVAGGASIQGQIDTIAPLNGATVAMTYANGDAAMVYHDDPYNAPAAGATPTLPNGGTGSRVVYAPFGLEAMSSDFYASDAPNPSQTPAYDLIIPPVFPRNVRQAILHNIVCFLRTGSVSGTITQTSGTGQGTSPVPGATVYLQPTGGAPSTRAAFSALTDGTGSYTIAGVEPGTYTLVAYKAGYTRATSNAGIAFTVEGDVNRTGASLTLNPVPPGSIAGTVTVAGSRAPILGATVVFTSVDKSTTVTGTTFNGSQAGQLAGTFLVPAVPVASYTGSASGPLNDQGLNQYQSSTQPSGPSTVPDPPFNTAFPVQSGSPSTGPVNFELLQVLASVSGHVFDLMQGDTAAGQAALAGATVQAYDSTGTTAIQGATATVARDGSYTIPNLPAPEFVPGQTQTPTTYVLKATKAGYQTPANAPTVTVSVFLGDVFTGKEIGLAPTPPGSVSGVVQDAAGNPIAGATVTFVASGVSVPVTTGADGRFSIASIPAGTYSVTAIGPKNPTGNPTTARSPAQTITITGGQAAGPLTFVLAVAPPTISGTVTDSTTKQPLPGVLVRIYDDKTGTVVSTTNTAADGTFNSGALPSGGTYTATFALNGYMNAVQGPFTLYNGDTEAGLAVMLTPIPPGSISGTVLDNSTPGLPVVGATVTFTPATGNAILTAVTDGNGNYVIPASGKGVAAGTYTATVASPTNTKGKPEYAAPAPQQVTVPPGAGVTANFVLSALRPVIVGTVFDVTTTTNIGGATVTLTPVTGTPVTVTANSSGVYSSGPLAPGTYTVTASAPGYFTGTGVPASGGSTTGSVTVELGDTSVGVNVPLSEKGTLFGLITDASTGAALPGTTLTITDAATGAPIITQPTPLVTTNPTTGTDGKPQDYLTSVPPGTYVLTATKSNYTVGSSAPFTVTNRTPVRVDVQLVSNIGTLGGLVTDATGAPVGGATVTVTATATKTTVATFTTSATASPAPDAMTLNYQGQINQGTYTVTLQKGTQGPISRTVVVKGGQFNRLDFTGANGLPALHTFAAGFQFVSAPFDYSGSTFDAIFGTLNTAPAGTTPNGNRSHVAVWDPTASGGLGMYMLDPNPPADAFRIGYGYWVYLKNSMPLIQAGTTPTAATVPVSLHPQWNQIGVANPAGTPVSSLLFDNGAGGTITFAQAVGSQYHLVYPTLFQYTAGSYQPVVQGDVLLPYRAYWIKVYADATLEEPTR